jgi:acyl-CoA synthetase (NDP forming)
MLMDTRTHEDIRRFLNPQSVAVIGASEDSTKFGGRVLEYLLKFGFPGTIVPVNVKAKTLRGVPAVPSIKEAPPVDVAIMAVPVEHAVEAVTDCARAGVKGCVLITAQFAEMGEEGARRQAAVVAAAREHGMRLLGPNCLGYVNPIAKTAMSSTLSLSAIERMPTGSIGLVSQSGALMGSMIAVGEEMGAGFSVCVSVGNQCDLELADFVEYLADDPATSVICLYVEGLVSPARFLAAVDRARENGKPVLMAKSGRTESGARAVKSHTASLAGSHAALQAACRAHGVVLIEDAIDMLSVAHCMSRLGPVREGGLALFSGSGGGAALLVDAIDEGGLRLATLSEATKRAMTPFLPDTHRHLPVDYGAMKQRIGTAECRNATRELMKIVMDDADVAAGIVLLTTQPDMDDIARATIETGAASGKPMLFVNAGGRAGAAAREVTQQESFPAFDRPVDAVRIAAALAEYARLHAMPARAVKADAGLASAIDAALKDLPRGLLNENETKRLLAAAGVPVTPEQLARSADEAARMARDIGFPVVLKAQARAVSHKSDIGGVVLNLASEDAVKSAFRAIAERVKSKANAELDGCLVQQMVVADVELIVGANWDEQFGAMLMVGIGGTLVELLKDVQLVPAPIDAASAVRLLRSLKLAPLFAGYRGKPPVDLDAVGAVIARISQLVAVLGPRLRELDVNPLLVAGSRAIVADARAVIDESTDKKESP